MVMAAAEQEERGGGLVPDLYQMLGVPLGASGGEITRSWRQRAAAEHPDRRPHDAAAPARFRALAAAYQVLGDPARRAAYDRTLGHQPGSGSDAPGGPAPGASPRPPRGNSVPVEVRRPGRAPEPPLRAGPVRVEVPPPASAPGPRAAERDIVRLAVLAELTARYLHGEQGRP